jgi:hypothetical protein
MRFDAENQLMVAQAIVGAAPVVSQNSYQMASVNQDISIGRMMSILFAATVAAGAGTSAFLEVITAQDGALTTNIISIAQLTVPASQLSVGNSLELPIPKGSLGNTQSNVPNLNQFLGVRITLTGGVTTVTLDAYLMPSGDIAKYKSFPKVVDALV